MAIRAKFRCMTVEQSTDQPRTEERYVNGEVASVSVWARTYRFSANYAQDVPEDQRFSLATPAGNLTLVVDKPDVVFEPGRSYYLDFTPAD
ncbi:hypothetical protein [Streptacidiphilus rugosus]|uniref:hypothetical protein n=1 Tax=Streptacidiphilus rugosus TaxID=405783 RepID=UPI000561D829|nr:hypothetical protein [Streptacidiphilus rugosus]